MTKVKFINIGLPENKTIGKEFKALKLSKRDKEKLYPYWNEDKIKSTQVLYPQTDSYWNKDSVFVRGLGTKKFTKTNWVMIPSFSGEIEDWDEYLSKYGMRCLFYSISGCDLDTMNCCDIAAKNEFYSLLQCTGGIKKYQEYVDTILKIQAIQTEKMNGIFSYMNEWEKNRTIEENLFRPSFAIFGLTMSPYLDTPNDDDKLERIYRTKRLHELRENHPLNKEHKRLLTDMRAIHTKYGDTKELWDMEDKDNEYYNTIMHDINEAVDKEMDEERDNPVFPVCMSDRMTMLFGEECNKLYDYILNEFKTE